MTRSGEFCDLLGGFTMAVRTVRSILHRRARFALFACALLTGCAASPPPADSGEEPLSPDERVLKALEPYDPVYKIDSTGRVVALKLEGKRIPASVLDEVCKLTELRELSLYMALLTDDSLVRLQGLSNLGQLGLGATPITAEGLAHLEPLKNLRHMWLSQSLTSTPAAEKLKAELPELTIHPQ
jgi:hypothetical protein